MERNEETGTKAAKVRSGDFEAEWNCSFSSIFQGFAFLDNARFLCRFCAAAPIFWQVPPLFPFFAVSSHASPAMVEKGGEGAQTRGGLEKFALTKKKGEGTLCSLTVRNDQEQKESLDNNNVYDK